MGKQSKKPKNPQDKTITGSGAEVVSHEDERERVKCKCVVACVWRGYRDEGDTVWIEKGLIEKDSFIKMHFKAVDGVIADVGQDGSGEEASGVDEADGSDQSQVTERNDDADGGADDGNGQGELGLG